MQQQDELVTLAAAARELGITRQRLGILAKEGRIGTQIAGRYWVFSRKEIEEFKPQVKISKGGRPKGYSPRAQKDGTPALVAGH